MSKFQSLLGIIVFIGICILLSENRKRISFKLIVGALTLQIVIAILLLKVPIATHVLNKLNSVVIALDTATKVGAQFVLGYLAGGPTPFELTSPQANFIIATQILPIILTISAIVGILYHFGIIQRVVWWISKGLQNSLGVDGATGLGVASSIFLGIIEAPIFVKPYLRTMSRSSFFTLIVAAMATVAGTVLVLYSTLLNGVIENPLTHLLTASFMSAPGAILFAKLLIPSDGQELELPLEKETFFKVKTKSVFEAIINGTSEGMNMIINIIGVLIVIFALIALINNGIAAVPGLESYRIESFASYIFLPFTWLMGIGSHEIFQASELMATKTILNEFVAYSQIGNFDLSQNSKTILIYAMCGFANFGSLGILIGGLIPIIPERKGEVLELGLKAMFAGTLATMTTGAIVNLLLW